MALDPAPAPVQPPVEADTVLLAAAVVKEENPDRPIKRKLREE